MYALIGRVRGGRTTAAPVTGRWRLSNLVKRIEPSLKSEGWTIERDEHKRLVRIAMPDAPTSERSGSLLG